MNAKERKRRLLPGQNLRQNKMCLKKDRLFDYVFVIDIHCHIYSLIMKHENEKIYMCIYFFIRTRLN